MNLVSWILLGLIAGTLAKVLHPGRDPGGCVLTVALGIAGAILGGYIGTQLGWGKVTGFDLRSLALAVGGALILLIARRFLLGRAR